MQNNQSVSYNAWECKTCGYVTSDLPTIKEHPHPDFWLITIRREC